MSEQMAIDENLVLLKAVAEARDKHAFNQLFQQVESAAYSLAFRITGSRDRAEEAVQEAMICVWRSASSFEPRAEGCVRSWILRIVARQCLSALRSSKRARVHATAETLDRISTERAPTEQMIREETLAELDKLVQALPELDRKVLAMHFGGGLSHQEIGTALEMPRRTISHKIEGSLKRLKAEMARDGFVASIPAVMDSGLADVFSSGYAASEHLQGQVADKVTQVSQRSSIPAWAGNASSPLVTGLIAASACIVLAGAVYLFAKGAKPNTTPVTSAPVPVAAIVPNSSSAKTEPAAQVSVKDTPFHATWTFEKGAPADIGIEQGAWICAFDFRGKRGDSLMLSPQKDAVVLCFPQILTDGCSLLSIQLEVYSEGEFACQPWLRKNGKYLEQQGWRKWLSLSNYRSHLCQIYQMGVYSILFMDGKPWTVRRHAESAAGAQMLLGLRNWAIRQVEFQSLGKDEVPAELRNPEEFLKGLIAAGWERDSSDQKKER